MFEKYHQDHEDIMDLCLICRADPNKGKTTEDPPSTQEFTMNCDHDGKLV